VAYAVVLLSILLLCRDRWERWRGGRAGEFVNGTSGVSYLASNLIKTIKERIAMRFIVSNNST